MKPYFSEIYGNPSSLHSFGQEAKKALDESREKVASILKAETEEIIFTSSGTESTNLALTGTALANRNKGRHIITSAIEHHAVLETCKWLEKNGFIDLEELENRIRNPHNMGRMENPAGVGKVGNPICGDVMFIYIKARDNVIEDIKFESFGCAAAIATSSVITDIAKGKTFEEALKITKKDIADAVGGLPPIKMHCSVLADRRLRAAIDNYLSRVREGKKNKQ